MLIHDTNLNATKLPVSPFTMGETGSLVAFSSECITTQTRI
jgi:hypothetical protein